MKKICVVTGSRAEYGLLKGLLFEISQSKKLKLQLVVCGTHLMKRFGYSVNEIKKDGFKIDYSLNFFVDTTKDVDVGLTIGFGIISFSHCFQKLKPDILIVLGDRFETFATVVAAACLCIPIAHLRGGECAGGGLDEIFRHCITKFSSIHFPATKEFAETIKKMGEESWRIHTVGATGMEGIIRLSKNKKIFDKRMM